MNKNRSDSSVHSSALNKVLAGEGRVLPQVEKTINHAVFLVSDPSFIPPRREARVLMERNDPERDVETISRHVKHYGGVTGLRARGILVCSEAGDRLLSLLKGFRDVEVVCLTRRVVSV